MFTTLFHDQPASAAFIAAVADIGDGSADVMSYWCEVVICKRVFFSVYFSVLCCSFELTGFMLRVFSDVFEQGGIIPKAFHGGFGLLTLYGTPKVGFPPLVLVHQF